eukprot:1591263-Rhodomonas_salina.1
MAEAAAPEVGISCEPVAGQEISRHLPAAAARGRGKKLSLFGFQSSLPTFGKSLVVSIIPVTTVLSMVLVITVIYAGIGTGNYRNRDPSHFGNFGDSLFTMVQVLTYDSWASSIARPLQYDGEGGDKDTGVQMFFISYFLMVLAAGIILFQAIVAVMLSEFVVTEYQENFLNVQER